MGKRTRKEDPDMEDMTPWEQHAAVISIPRFNYDIPSSLLQHSYSGFLITCTIKREKSATKEAISVFNKFIGLSSHLSLERLESSERSTAAKPQKLCAESLEGHDVESIENITVTKRDMPSEVEAPGRGRSNTILSLVKLTRRGLILFTLPENSCIQPAYVLSDIFSSLTSGALNQPQWCHRFFPIQATCILSENHLHSAVSSLVQKYLEDDRHESLRPIKFAVGYNRRGIEEVEMNTLRDGSENSNFPALLGRDTCIKVVAGAVKDVVAYSAVDLNDPELAVLVELLPLSGVPQGLLVAAVSVLPHTLIAVKPRLSVKALVSCFRS